jgi:hypothetical protein
MDLVPTPLLFEDVCTSVILKQDGLEAMFNCRLHCLCGWGLNCARIQENEGQQTGLGVGRWGRKERINPVHLKVILFFFFFFFFGLSWGSFVFFIRVRNRRTCEFGLRFAANPT